MPSVQRVHEALKDTEAVVLLMAIDGGGKQRVQSYLAEQAVTVRTLVDARMEVARKFGVRAVPTTFVVDRSGAVVAVGRGPVDFDSPALLKYIQGLLARSHG